MPKTPHAQVFLVCDKVTWDGPAPTLSTVIMGMGLPGLAAHQKYKWEITAFWITKRNRDPAEHKVSLRFLDPHGNLLAHWPPKPMPATENWAHAAELLILFLPIEGRYSFVLDLDGEPFATAPVEVVLVDAGSVGRPS
jgi:hypothetical protein